MAVRPAAGKARYPGRTEQDLRCLHPRGRPPLDGFGAWLDSEVLAAAPRAQECRGPRGQQGLSIPANPRSLTGSIKSMDAHLEAIGHDYGANDIHHVEIDSAPQIIDSVYQIHRYKDREMTG